MSTDFKEVYAAITGFAVPNSLTTLAKLEVAGLERVLIQISNTGSNPLTACQLQTQGHENALAVSVLASATADFTTPGNIVMKASGDLTGLAASGNGWVLVDVRGLRTLIIAATSTLGTTVSVFMSGNSTA